jgi:hypothetical protein
MDPFKLNEVDGFFYGRGTSDIKRGDTLLVANFLRLKEGWTPARPDHRAVRTRKAAVNGVRWLVRPSRAH